MGTSEKWQLFFKYKSIAVSLVTNLHYIRKDTEHLHKGHEQIPRKRKCKVVWPYVFHCYVSNLNSGSLKFWHPFGLVLLHVKTQGSSHRSALEFQWTPYKIHPIPQKKYNTPVRASQQFHNLLPIKFHREVREEVPDQNYRSAWSYLQVSAEGYVYGVKNRKPWPNHSTWRFRYFLLEAYGQIICKQANL